jgi:hypothetical protein
VKSCVVSSYGERKQDFCFIPTYEDKTIGILGSLSLRFTIIKDFAFVC